MSFEIRAARHDDVASIAAWTADTFEWSDYVAERLPSWIDDSDSQVVVAADRTDSPVGVSHCLLLSDREAWLEGARVHPDHRRGGVASAMNQAGLDWAQDRGARVARLAIEKDNTAAQRQVEAMGYRAVSNWIHTRLSRHDTPQLLDDDGFRLTTAADVEPGWLTWATSELARSGKELISLGWRWRQATLNDIFAAASEGNFYQSPSGWVVLTPREDRFHVGWLATGPHEAPTTFAAIIDLIAKLELEEATILVPSLPWVSETIIRVGATPREVLVYAIPLISGR